MKRRSLPGRDEIDALMSESWESIPQHLQQRLMIIPDRIRPLETSRYDWFLFFLNSVLGIWFFGLVLYFRESLFVWSVHVSNETIKVWLKIPELIVHPLFIIGLIGCLAVGWFWLDVGSTSSTGKGLR